MRTTRDAYSLYVEQKALDITHRPRKTPTSAHLREELEKERREAEPHALRRALEVFRKGGVR